MKGIERLRGMAGALGRYDWGREMGRCLAEAADRIEEERDAAEIVGWLEGFVPTVWLLPMDKVSDEVPATYERMVARLRELVTGEEAE